MADSIPKQPKASARAPFLLEMLYGLALLAAFCLIPDVMAAEDVQTKVLAGSNYPMAREALVEAVESEGFVVSAVIPFGDMLERTAGALGKAGSPYQAAEIVQFCSASLARQLVDEDATQIALCPLTIAVFTLHTAPGKVTYAYRRPASTSEGRQAAEKLLAGLVDRAAAQARLR